MVKRFSVLIVAILVALLSFRGPAFAQESPDMGMNQGGGDQIQQPNDNGNDAHASQDNPDDQNAEQDQNQDQNQGDSDGDRADTGDTGDNY